jgi:hypothetical protein
MKGKQDTQKILDPPILPYHNAFFFCVYSLPRPTRSSCLYFATLIHNGRGHQKKSEIL